MITASSLSSLTKAVFPGLFHLVSCIFAYTKGCFYGRVDSATSHKHLCQVSNPDWVMLAGHFIFCFISLFWEVNWPNLEYHFHHHILTDKFPFVHVTT